MCFVLISLTTTNAATGSSARPGAAALAPAARTAGPPTLVYSRPDNPGFVQVEAVLAALDGEGTCGCCQPRQRPPTRVSNLRFSIQMDISDGGSNECQAPLVGGAGAALFASGRDAGGGPRCLRTLHLPAQGVTVRSHCTSPPRVVTVRSHCTSPPRVVTVCS